MSNICRALRTAGAVLVLVCTAAQADDAAPQLAPNTEVHLRLLVPVASNTHKHGDHFPLEVVDPVVVDGTTIIPAGAQGEGEVVHASKAGIGGRAGELILVSRFVKVGDHTIRLRSFSAGNGQDRVNLAFGVGAAVGLVAVFIQGKNIVLPAGTDVYAKVAADTPPPSPVPNPASNGAQQDEHVQQ